jgi:pyruvate-formate lyase-activating enzyme
MTDIERAMMEATYEVVRDIKEREDNGQGAAPIVDPQADNMTRAAELVVAAMREATAETAKRFTEATAQVVAEALAAEEDAKAFTKRLIDHTEDKAAEFMDFFQRRRNAALALTEIKSMLALPSKDTGKQ